MLDKHNKRAPPTKNRNFSNSGELIMNFLSARFSRTRKEETLPWGSNFSTIFCVDIPHNTRKGSGKSRIIPITPRFNLNFPPKRPIFKNGKGGSLARTQDTEYDKAYANSCTLSHFSEFRKNSLSVFRSKTLSERNPTYT